MIIYYILYLSANLSTTHVYTSSVSLLYPMSRFLKSIVEEKETVRGLVYA